MSFNVPKFVPEKLVGGDTNQLQYWIMGKSNSIYVKWTPDELSEHDAYHYFSALGFIKRVEFVPYKTGKGRMLFVHFEQWHESPLSIATRKEIANAYPGEYSMPMIYNMTNGSQKTYTLKCCVNIRPIPTVEYNTHQLSDMFERLNTRITGEVDQLREEVQTLKAEIQRLNEIIRHNDNDDDGDETHDAVIHPEN